MLVGALLGCPGSLDDPDRFLAAICAGGCDAGSLDGAVTSTDAVAGILIPKCGLISGCHATRLPAEGLDVTIPDLARALSTRTSSSMACGGRPMLVPGDPAGSLIYTKLLDPSPCGFRMPYGGPFLSEEELATMRAWIEAQE